MIFPKKRRMNVFIRIEFNCRVQRIVWLMLSFQKKKKWIFKINQFMLYLKSSLETKMDLTSFFFKALTKRGPVFKFHAHIDCGLVTILIIYNRLISFNAKKNPRRDFQTIFITSICVQNVPKRLCASKFNK